MNENLFEIASKEKFRYPFKGLVTTEDLWDLRAEDLDMIYKNLNAQKKRVNEESLLSADTPEDKTLARKIEVVKYVFSMKQAQAEAAIRARVAADKRRKIDELIAAKQDAKMAEMSIEDLEKLRDQL